jgi:NDP-sugar pyrophosphorylase family protein
VEVQAVILCGGLATRLGPLAKSRPKSMITIEGKPFLEYQLEMLKKKGIQDVVLCTGYKGEQIQDYFGDGKGFGVNIRYSVEKTPLGTAGALKNAVALLNDIFTVIYGDSYLFLDFGKMMAHFNFFDKTGMMTVYQNLDRYDKSNTIIEGDFVIKYSKTDKSEAMKYIDYGANVFRKNVLEMIPRDRFYSLEELFAKLIEQKQMLAYEVKERFYEIGSTEGLAEFGRFIKNGGI